MRNQVTHVATALALAALAVACSGRNHVVGNDRRAQGGGNRGINEHVALRGCVQPAVTDDGYALRHVVLPPPAEQPQGQETAEHPLIQPGSSVRLAAGKDMTDDLKSYLNKEVTIIGDVVDPGQGTIGTSGTTGAVQEMPPNASAPTSQAPKIAVEKVQKIAENCAGE